MRKLEENRWLDCKRAVRAKGKCNQLCIVTNLALEAAFSFSGLLSVFAKCFSNQETKFFFIDVAYTLGRV